MKVRITLVLALLVSAIGFGSVQASHAAACGPDAGSEWNGYGGALDNMRWQREPGAINPGTVGNIAPAWIFDSESVQLDGGSFTNTPVIADGCVYLGSSSGFVYALNADSGEHVWTSNDGDGNVHRFVGAPTGSLAGRVITGSLVVEGGRVFAGVSKVGDPYVGVVDQATGALIGEWDVIPPEYQGMHRTAVVSSPVIMNGMLFQGIMADEASEVARGAFSILDVDPTNEIEDGTILAFTWVIDDAEYAHGYRGASIWCSPAADPDEGFIYACGGNPASKQIEHRYSNALLKIDMRRGSDTFGQIIDSYKGDVDQYYPGLDRQPACDQVPTTVVWSPTCVQQDLDFGSSPNLYTVTVGDGENAKEVKILGALQKSGVFHAVFADQMERAWTAIVGTPCFACNAGSSATDGDQIYVNANLPGQVVALSADRGRYRWAAPIVSGTFFQSASVANGVMYTMDNYGFLNAFDAETGVPLVKRNLYQDTGEFAGDLSSQGIAIARDTVFASSARFVIAYR